MKTFDNLCQSDILRAWLVVLRGGIKMQSVFFGGCIFMIVVGWFIHHCIKSVDRDMQQVHQSIVNGTFQHRSVRRVERRQRRRMQRANRRTC